MMNLLRLFFFFLSLSFPLFSQETSTPVVVHDEVIEEFENFDVTSELLNILSTLGLVILLILGMAWILKRVLRSREEQMNSQSNIKVLERRTLSPRSAVYLLEIEGKGFVVGESPAGLQSLGNLPLSEERSFDSYMESPDPERTHD